jgi:hypothetical protein
MIVPADEAEEEADDDEAPKAEVGISIIARTRSIRMVEGGMGESYQMTDEASRSGIRLANMQPHICYVRLQRVGTDSS